MTERAVREALGLPYFRFMPQEAIAAACASFEYGSKKYSARNWEKGLPWQQMIDSLKRHISDFELGYDYDDSETGSGLHQVCMIMASASMLTTSVLRNIGEDNRTKAFDGTFDSKKCAKFIEDQLKLAEEFKSAKSLVKAETPPITFHEK